VGTEPRLSLTGQVQSLSVVCAHRQLPRAPTTARRGAHRPEPAAAVLAARPGPLAGRQLCGRSTQARSGYTVDPPTTILGVVLLRKKLETPQQTLYARQEQRFAVGARSGPLLMAAVLRLVHGPTMAAKAWKVSARARTHPMQRLASSAAVCATPWFKYIAMSRGSSAHPHKVSAQACPSCSASCSTWAPAHVSLLMKCSERVMQ